MKRVRIPRVLHIFGRLNRGGAELRTIDVMRRSKLGDVHLEFLSLSGLPGELDNEVRALGGMVHYCPLDWLFPRRFQQLLRERRIDVVHSHVHHFSGFILRCAASAGIPVRIAHFRSVDSGKPDNLRRRLQERLMRHWLNRWATLILGNGEASLRGGWMPDWMRDTRCAVIHNGLDITPFCSTPDPLGVRREFGWADTCPLAIHVGRLDPAKNHERLVKIWGAMSSQSPEMRFLSAGLTEPALLTRLQAHATALGMAGKVAWAGGRGDVPRLLLAADTMVFPSIVEGLPGAVLEACAAGVPVIGSEIPSIREIADRFINVECIPLSGSNAHWATTALARDRPALAQRIVAREEVARSVYGINLCVQAHLAAWNGASGLSLRQFYADEPENRSREAA